MLPSKKIIGTHNGHRAGVNALLEMGEIYLLQSLFICMDIHRKSDVFNAVAGKMLWAGDNAVILHRFCQCSAHFSEQKRILAICFLRSAQRGLRKRLMHIPAK